MLIPVSEWAANEGITHQGANKRIRDHGIPKHDGKVDPDEARRIFEAGKDLRQQERSRSKRTAKPPAAGSPASDIGEGASRPEIQKALDAVKLKREQIKLQQLEGSLIDAEQVKSETEKRFRAEAESLLKWPARVAADIAAELGVEERPTHAALEKYIRVHMRERSMVPVPA